MSQAEAAEWGNVKESRHRSVGYVSAALAVVSSVLAIVAFAMVYRELGDGVNFGAWLWFLGVLPLSALASIVGLALGIVSARQKGAMTLWPIAGVILSCVNLVTLLIWVSVEFM